MHKKYTSKIDNIFLGIPPLLLYIKLHNISETTFFSETLCGGAV
jgi:hypothetical protein